MTLFLSGVAVGLVVLAFAISRWMQRAAQQEAERAEYREGVEQEADDNLTRAIAEWKRGIATFTPEQQEETWRGIVAASTPYSQLLPPENCDGPCDSTLTIEECSPEQAVERLIEKVKR